ncbi:MAG: ABC transporter substrate-binding protein, partial [Alphaproteobacteria bacterium]
MKLAHALAALLVALIAAGPLATPVRATELHVVSSGGFAAAYKALVPEWEKQTGNTVVAAWGPSMGTT